ncbi:hypothetical protein SAMN02745165_00284 [Malonomonas rubra DSM 5091]|uniref:Uncharacterized protein n=1 Tax=Malonomonas rubra DSM 5091 TaxID=1122189 RepID=A0A1M6BSF9_MALRU|nr:hypothetical protein [Malonomonas rubra]SHI51662.1 hypothetical protein SAMN02745165_00284 [Malonomonas rubra DSM 5091]
MFWFIVLLLLAGAGFYFYQKMMTIEREIREEQDAAQADAEPVEEAKVEEVKAEEPAAEEASDPPVVTPEVEKMAAKAEPVADVEMNLEDEILEAVKNLPGMKQTDIYTSFADVGKSQLQKLLKEMDDDGKLKREKKGSSYLLYPAED